MWYTDVLTPAQKLKHKLFVAKLLRMPEEQMLRAIAEWMFSDEKWWDIVGPAYYKRTTNWTPKLKSRCFIFVSVDCYMIIARHFCLCIFLCRWSGIKVKKVEYKSVCILGEASVGG